MVSIMFIPAAKILWGAKMKRGVNSSTSPKKLFKISIFSRRLRGDFFSLQLIISLRK